MVFRKDGSLAPGTQPSIVFVFEISFCPVCTGDVYFEVSETIYFEDREQISEKKYAFLGTLPPLSIFVGTQPPAHPEAAAGGQLGGDQCRGERVRARGAVAARDAALGAGLEKGPKRRNLRSGHPNYWDLGSCKGHHTQMCFCCCCFSHFWGGVCFFFPGQP